MSWQRRGAPEPGWRLLQMRCCHLEFAGWFWTRLSQMHRPSAVIRNSADIPLWQLGYKPDTSSSGCRRPLERAMGSTLRASNSVYVFCNEEKRRRDAATDFTSSGPGPSVMHSNCMATYRCMAWANLTHTKGRPRCHAETAKMGYRKFDAPCAGIPGSPVFL